MNFITVIGNVGRDPELRFTQSGVPVCKLPLADTRGKKGEDQKTIWYDVVTFNELAETMAEELRKGDRLIVVGKLQIEDYTKKDGTKGKRVEIIADHIGDVIKAYKRVNSDEMIERAFTGDEEPF